MNWSGLQESNLHSRFGRPEPSHSAKPAYAVVPRVVTSGCKRWRASLPLGQSQLRTSGGFQRHPTFRPVVRAIESIPQMKTPAVIPGFVSLAGGFAASLDYLSARIFKVQIARFSASVYWLGGGTFEPEGSRYAVNNCSR